MRSKKSRISWRKPRVGRGFAEGVGPGGAGCDAFGVVGEQFADDDVLLGAGEEFEVAFYAAE